MELANEVHKSASLAEAASILTEGLVLRLCRILAISPQECDRGQPANARSIRMHQAKTPTLVSLLLLINNSKYLFL